MIAIREGSALAPFRVSTFRFQWPADLATSWAFEMENLILAWYVLTKTHSVVVFTIFASLQYLGTLLAPALGVVSDRIGHNPLLCGMRGLYAVFAATLTTLIATGVLTPLWVIAIAALMGLVRPSDIGMRYAFIGETMPPGYLMGAMGIQRTTQDSARVAGSLSGAGLVAVLGMGWTYALITTFYASSFLLTFLAGRRRLPQPAAMHDATTPVPRSPWRDLKEGSAYVWNTPILLAAMSIAFLLNATAFPQFNALLPVVAREVLHGGRPLLGALIASGASGSLVGSILQSKIGGAFHPARMMVLCSAGWYAALLVFAHLTHPLIGMFVLFLGGIAQSSALVPMSAILMREAQPQYRGRVMGARMLAIYGNLPGLLLAGPLIGHFGYPATATSYCVIGLVATLMIALYWRGELWRIVAPAKRN